MSIYLDTYRSFIINCRYFVAQLYTHEDGLSYISGAPFIDDVMSYNLLTTYALFMSIYAYFTYLICIIQPAKD